MPRKRSMKGYVKLPFRLQGGLGAITSGQFSGIDLGDTVNERTWISSVFAAFGLQGLTVGEGPHVLYVAHSDYSNTEVEEAIKAATSWDQGDLVSREQANRKVRLIGNIGGESADEVLNDGKPMRIRLGFMLEEGDTLQFGVFAQTGNITTGAAISVAGHANGWKR